MTLVEFFKNINTLRTNAGALAKIQKEHLALKSVHAQLSSDFLTLKGDVDLAYKGNMYGTYEAAVLEIDKKYSGTADWGVLQVGNIIDIRAAFIIAEGVQVTDATDDKSAEQELEFCEAFLSYNDLDREMAQDFAKEAEIEGKILMKLAWDDDDEQVQARYVSWTSKKYEVIVDPQDYTWYKQVKWRTMEGKEELLEEPVFVYKKFGGRVNKPNEAAPKVMKCLTQIEDLDKALRDLREINRLFAAPILNVKFESPTDAKQAQEDLDKMNWKIKKALCTTGDLTYVQPDASGVNGLVNEITNLAKVISGATGVPVHFLGLPDLMSNRATAENLMELVYASTLKERQIWIGAYKEMLTKAMTMYNEKTGLAQKTTALDPSKINVDIPYISEKNWSIVRDIFVPLAIGGIISKEMLLAKLPGVNAEEELARDEEQEKGAPKPPKSKPEDFTDEEQVAAEEGAQ